MAGQRGLPTLLILLLVLGGFGVLLWSNTSPAVPLAAAFPTQAQATEAGNAWIEVLREGFGENSTPLPTVEIPTQSVIIPTLSINRNVPIVPLNAADVGGDPDEAALQLVTPTLPVATRSAEDLVSAAVTVQSVTRPPVSWQPPPLLPPISRDPLNRDHYWLRRPVDSNARNRVLSSYPYGSDGPEQNNPMRVHHGIDMPNEVGEQVRSAGSGYVVWPSESRADEITIFQNSPSYGNVIVIEHDFGHQGRPLYTLYAHLSAVFVGSGQFVEGGEVIGLVGNTGRVTGPHVHFEVRLGENTYGSTVNPALWMVPYVGHGVIVGRVVDANERFIDDVNITIRNFATGLQEATTTSYVFAGTGSEVNSDPVWDENFVVPDVPAGRYDVIAVIDGQRVVRQVQVVEGTSAFVELRLAPPPSPSPASDG